MSLPQNTIAVYVIKDNVSKQCTPLMLCPNEDTAKRQFGQFLEGASISPADFDLYFVGQFDPNVPRIDYTDDNSHIVNGAAIRPELTNEKKS